MKAGRRGATDDVPPPAFDPIARIPVSAAIGAIGLDGIEGTRSRGDAPAHPLEVVPVDLPLFLIVLRDITKRISLGVVEGSPVLIAPQIPGVPHLGDQHPLVSIRGMLLDKLSPVGAPGLLAGRFVVHTVEHMIVLEGVGEEFNHETLLILEHR